jgi:hypothetical protein
MPVKVGARRHLTKSRGITRDSGGYRGYPIYQAWGTIALVTLKDLEKRIDQLLAQAETALANARRDPYSGSLLMQSADWTALRAAGLSFIESTFGREHSYYKEFDQKVRDSSDYYGRYALGILSAIKNQIVGGWIETMKGLVTAEVFADFLEMAEHLLEQKYKDPAAVLVGSVLEEHLRQLCAAVGVPIEDLSSGRPVARKADTLNAELARAGKYSKLDQKLVTAWLDLRNKAAHGRYSDYTAEQVRGMFDGVRDFIARVRP